MNPLPDPKNSFAVLIGTSDYTRESGQAQLPAVRNNVDALAAMLTDPALGGLPPERCKVIRNPDNVFDLSMRLREYADQASDTFFVYFAGHGQTLAGFGLYLTLSNTDTRDLHHSALAYARVREMLRDCRALRKVVILDCCYSGQAIETLSATDDLAPLAIEGTYVLTATAGTVEALTLPGATYTAFTDHLLRIVYRGIPGAGAYLPYYRIFPVLQHDLRAHGLPLPRRSSGGSGTVDELALSRNPAHQTSAPPRPRRPGTPIPPPPPRPTPRRAPTPHPGAARRRLRRPESSATGPTRPPRTSTPTPAAPPRTSAPAPIRPTKHLRKTIAAVFTAAILGAGVVLFPRLNLSLPDLPIPFLQSRTPVHATASGPAPWTIEGYGWRYTVESVERTVSEWQFKQNPSITITAYVERTKSADFSSMSFGIRDQSSGTALEAVPFQGGGDSQPPLHQRSRLVHVVNDSDPLATRLTITLHDFYWPDGRDLILSDIPSPSES